MLKFASVYRASLIKRKLTAFSLSPRDQSIIGTVVPMSLYCFTTQELRRRSLCASKLSWWIFWPELCGSFLSSSSPCPIRGMGIWGCTMGFWGVVPNRYTKVSPNTSTGLVKKDTAFLSLYPPWLMYSIWVSDTNVRSRLSKEKKNRMTRSKSLTLDKEWVELNTIQICKIPIPNRVLIFQIQVNDKSFFGRPCNNYLIQILWNRVYDLLLGSNFLESNITYWELSSRDSEDPSEKTSWLDRILVVCVNSNQITLSQREFTNSKTLRAWVPHLSINSSIESTSHSTYFTR